MVVQGRQAGRGGVKSGAEGRVYIFERQAGKYSHLKRGFGESFQKC